MEWQTKWLNRDFFRQNFDDISSKKNGEKSDFVKISEK
jgi:hypothetical protein